MKAADLKNLFNEYGMSPGPSTPVSQQQSGANAKTQQSATASSASPSAAPSSSPSTAPSASPQTQDSDQVDQQPQALVVKADQLEKDAVFPSEKGDPVKVISPANSFDPNVPDDAEDSVIVHDERTDQYYALDPDADIAIPHVEETVFDRFDQLSLVEQLTVLSQLNSDIINEAWGKKKTLENTKPHFLKPGELSGSWSDAQLKSLGFRKASNDSWFISQAKWNKLLQLGERRWRSLISESAQVHEGEVISMQARKTPLVIAGRPFDWNIYDLRNNKMVANVSGGERLEDGPLYEIRINRNGMTKEARMPPTYILITGPNNNPPYEAFELVPPGEHEKIEKSPGPGGTTKIRPDGMDRIEHLAKTTSQGKYYGYDTVLVEEGLDPYELIEKSLGAKIMKIDDAWELGYIDQDPEDDEHIIYVGNQKKEGYSASTKIDRSDFYEGVPNNDSEYLLRKIMSQPLLTGDIRAQMNAYIALPDPDMLLQFRLMRAEGGDYVDLRSVVKQYMEKLHPKIKKQFDV